MNLRRKYDKEFKTFLQTNEVTKTVAVNFFTREKLFSLFKFELAKKPDTPTKVLVELLKDDSQNVRAQAALHLNSPLPLVKKLAFSDRSTLVRERASFVTLLFFSLGSIYITDSQVLQLIRVVGNDQHDNFKLLALLQGLKKDRTHNLKQKDKPNAKVPTKKV